MTPDADAAGRALAAFESRRSPQGLFLSYCRGRARHFPARLLYGALCVLVLLRVADPSTALLAAALAIGADAIESLALYRIGRARLGRRPARLKVLLVLTAALGGLQALTVDWFLYKLVALGGAEVQAFAAAICMAALLDSALLWGLHRPAAIVRLAIYGTSLLVVAGHALGTAGAVDPAERLFFDAMAVLLLAHIFFTFARHVLVSRRRHAEKEGQLLRSARDLAAANAALRESRETSRRLAMVAEQVGDAIIITDAGGIVTWVNAAFTRMTGYSAREAVGQHIRLVNGPETDPAALDMLMSARREGRPARTQIVNHRKDGSALWVETSLTPVLDAAGRVASVISVERDIGHVKAREAALAQASAAAAEAAQAKDTFLATISHELRTPMNGMIGNVELLRETALTPDQREMVETVGASAEALLDIVNDVLDLSALEAGRLSVGAAPFDLGACLRSVAGLMRPVAERKGLRFRLDMPEAPPPRLLGDAGRLRQVLSNLLGNAIKFTEAGSVSLALRWAVCDGGARLSISVRDTGIGIPEECLEEVFRSFAQASPEIAQRYGGTGLGLPISRQLVEAMGGTLTVASRPELGSEFRIALTLPQAASAPGPAAGPAPASPRTDEDEAGQAAPPDGHPSESRAARAAADVGSLAETAPEAGAAAASRTDEARVAMPASTAGGAPGRAEEGQKTEEQPEAQPETQSEAQTEAQPETKSEAQSEAQSEARAGPAQSGGRPDERAGYAGRRLLVADDNPANLRLVAAMLRGTGVRVDCVADGEAALARALAVPPDAVLMDMQMPRRDGPSAARAIREAEAKAGRAATPILALTASALPASQTACREAGMTGFLTKPVRKGSLFAALDALWSAADGARPDAARHAGTPPDAASPRERMRDDQIRGAAPLDDRIRSRTRRTDAARAAKIGSDIASPAATSTWPRRDGSAPCDGAHANPGDPSHANPTQADATEADLPLGEQIRNEQARSARALTEQTLVGQAAAGLDRGEGTAGDQPSGGHAKDETMPGDASLRISATGGPAGAEGVRRNATHGHPSPNDPARAHPTEPAQTRLPPRDGTRPEPVHGHATGGDAPSDEPKDRLPPCGPAPRPAAVSSPSRAPGHAA